MRILPDISTVRFMSWRYWFMGLSAAMVLISIVAIGVRGFNFSIDFTGGVLVEVAFPQAVDLAPLRSALNDAGYPDPTVQYFGTTREVMVRLAPQAGARTSDVSGRILDALQADFAEVELTRVEFVGPQVGDELAEQGSLALLFALIGVLIYVSLRFEWRLSLGAVFALVHDVLVTCGVFALFQLPFDMNVLAALLAIVGYSVNDTIVVFDRVRENFRRMRKGTTIDIFNNAITQTMSRTLVTSLTVLLVLIALYFLGGDSVHMFSLALTIGVIVGTYSSIFVASALSLEMGVRREHMIPKPKEEVDDLP